MSQDIEARIARLEKEVERLSELVGKFTIGDVGGDVVVTVNGGIQGLSINVDDAGGDVTVSMQTAQGVSVNADDVGGDVTVNTESGSVVVNANEVGGDVG